MSTTFQKYAIQSNLTNVEFKMLKNGSCPWFRVYVKTNVKETSTNLSLD
jgi:hypothetical protein